MKTVRFLLKIERKENLAVLRALLHPLPYRCSYLGDNVGGSHIMFLNWMNDPHA